MLDLVSGKNTLNWMTGSSVDTFASLDSYATGDATSGGQSKSAVLAVRKFGKVKPVGAGFGEGRLKSLKKNGKCIIHSIQINKYRI